MARIVRWTVLVFALVFVIPVQALEGCKACVIGGDAKAYCYDPDVVHSTFTLYANCRSTTLCYYMPGGGVQCWPACSGLLCALA